jgi:hypothetical protein
VFANSASWSEHYSHQWKIFVVALTVLRVQDDRSENMHRTLGTSVKHARTAARIAIPTPVSTEVWKAQRKRM